MQREASYEDGSVGGLMHMPVLHRLTDSPQKVYVFQGGEPRESAFESAVRA